MALVYVLVSPSKRTRHVLVISTERMARQMLTTEVHRYVNLKTLHMEMSHSRAHQHGNETSSRGGDADVGDV